MSPLWALVSIDSEAVSFVELLETMISENGNWPSTIMIGDMSTNTVIITVIRTMSGISAIHSGIRFDIHALVVKHATVSRPC